MRRLQLQENRSATILAPVRVTQFWAWSDWWIWHVCWIIVLGVIWLLGKWCNVGNIIYAGCSTSYCLLSKPSKTKEQHEGGGGGVFLFNPWFSFTIPDLWTMQNQETEFQAPGTLKKVDSWIKQTSLWWCFQCCFNDWNVAKRLLSFGCFLKVLYLGGGFEHVYSYRPGKLSNLTNILQGG